VANNSLTDVNAYLDGELGPEEAAEIEALLDEDANTRAQFEAFSRQKVLLGEAMDAFDAGPQNLETVRLEHRLASALHMRAAPRRVIAFGALNRTGSQLAAACALVAFGWWGHVAWSTQEAGIPGYVSEALGAHLIFAEDTLHPAEFTGGALDGATTWFSEKVGAPVAAPDLAAHGITLVGGRLLGTKEGPLAQFIYEDINGGRYSLTLSRHPAGQPVSPFQVVDYPNRAVGYWSTSDIDFALVGNSNTTSVQTLAQDLGARL